MCGIAGLLEYRGGPFGRHRQTVADMLATLVHRGPDASGTWSDDANVVLGHRRLSIVDLSQEGAQPMQSESARWHIVINGEIYNHVELRTELQQLGAHFRGHSDTEVFLAAIDQWGLERAVERSNGMFAFALWDAREKVLWFGRDRMGKKPLYYGWVQGKLAFASELKALMALPEFERRVSTGALDSMLRFNGVHGEQSICEGVWRLPQGTLMRFDRSTRDGAQGRRVTYWDPTEVAMTAMERRGASPATNEELEGILRDACRLRALADVPVGAFLSGGVDSSLVVALMQSQSLQPVRTFSIGFHEATHNEADHAKAVGAHLGTEHTELYVTPEETREVIPRLADIYDEPFADPSQIPTTLVSELARRDVTVAISGDGGDELFLGYHRYPFTQKWWDKTRFARRIVPTRLGAMGHAFLSTAATRLPTKGSELAKFSVAAAMLGATSPEAFYRILLAQWNDTPEIVRGAVMNPASLAAQSMRPLAAEATIAERCALEDAHGYLVDDILVKVDRASMSTSLEVRAPILDYRVFEAAWRFPAGARRDQHKGKLPLLALLYQHVPRELIDRPKQGFGVPVGEWIRGPLRDWAESLLSERALNQHGLLDTQRVRLKWTSHLSGRRLWAPELWGVLMFQSWWQRWMS